MTRHFRCDSVTLTLELTYFFLGGEGNFNIVQNIWTVSARAIIFHRSISNDKTLGTNTFYPLTLALEFGLLFENFNLFNKLSSLSETSYLFCVKSCHKKNVAQFYLR